MSTPKQRPESRLVPHARKNTSIEHRSTKWKVQSTKVKSEDKATVHSVCRHTAVPSRVHVAWSILPELLDLRRTFPDTECISWFAETYSATFTLAIGLYIQ